MAAVHHDGYKETLTQIKQIWGVAEQLETRYKRTKPDLARHTHLPNWL